MYGRRKLLRTLTAAATVGVAGCSGDQSSPSTVDTVTVGGQHTAGPTATDSGPGSLSPSLVTTLTASDGSEGDNFGSEVALQGERALVTAPSDDNGNGTDAGAAYVFEPAGSGWTEVAKLDAGSDSATFFGNTVALGPDIALVGVGRSQIGIEPSTGAVLRFEREAGRWRRTSGYAPSPDALEARTAAGFGESVALGERYVAVGAPQVNGRGSVFVYDRREGGEPARLTPSGLSSLAGFGRSVAVDGNVLVAGAPGDRNRNGAVAGTAFVYEYLQNRWTRTATLVAPDGGGRDAFGRAVTVDDTTTLVGAPGANGPDGQPGAGVVYAFDGSGDTLTRGRLVREQPAADDGFGLSVAIRDGVAVAGASQVDTGGTSETGAAYLYTGSKTDWSQQARLAPDTLPARAAFGTSVALGDRLTLVGAFGADTLAPDAGSAYLYQL